MRLHLECFHGHMCVSYRDVLCIVHVCGSVTVGICSSPGYPGFNEDLLEKEKVTDCLFATPI